MSEPRMVNLSDIDLKNLFETEVRALSDYAVCFVNFSDQPSGVDASAAGSGTLVSVDGLHGILTATHVIDEIRKRQKIGLTLPATAPSDCRWYTHNLVIFITAKSMILW